MLQAFLRALASLTDRRLLPIWLKSLAATALVFGRECLAIAAASSRASVGARPC